MLIAFTGNDGSGKSTQVRRVAEWLHSERVRVEIVDKWEILDRDRHPECRFITTPLADLQVCIAEMEGPARAMFLFWSILLTIQRHARGPQESDCIYLLDGYYHKHAAAELCYGVDQEWIESSTRLFPRPDITFYFDVDPMVALKRKQVLTPYECGRSPRRLPSEFLEHQTAVRRVLRSWAARDGWIELEAASSAAEITERIQAHLRGVGAVA